MDGNRVGRQAGPQPAAGAMARSGPWDPNVIATLIASWAWTGRWTLRDALEELGDSAWTTLTYSASFGLFLRRKTERLCSPSTLSALPELLRRCHGGAGWQQRRTLWMATNSPHPHRRTLCSHKHTATDPCMLAGKSAYRLLSGKIKLYVIA